MIYTVTFNPSLDHIVTVDNFRTGLTNRSSSEMILPGGKGINVSIVLSNLGVKNTAIYFSAGFVGREITRLVEEAGIAAEAIVLPDGCSRINTKLRSVETIRADQTESSTATAKQDVSDHFITDATVPDQTVNTKTAAETDEVQVVETEINASGPTIPSDKISELFARLDKLEAGDILVLAGSIPKSMPDTIYSDIMQRLEGRGVKMVVDATGKLLMNVLQYKPFLIKPNNHELGEIFGVQLSTRQSVIPYAKKLQEMGAENVLISLGGEGGVLIAADGSVLESDAPKGELVNSVGAGDSMVAGFVAGITEQPADYTHAFKLGLSAGSASAFSEFLATKDEIDTLYMSIC